MDFQVDGLPLLGRIMDATLQGDVEKELTMASPQLIPEVLLNTKGIEVFGRHTPLTLAASVGNMRAVTVLMEYQNTHCGGQFKLISNTNIHRALYEAASNQHQAIITILLGAIDDVNRVGCNGETALHVLCRCGKDVKSIVESLISRGAKLDISDLKGETSLFDACREGHEDVVELLLKEGAVPNHRSLSLATPLHAAAARPDCGVARLLCQHGASVSQDANGFSPLLLAARQSSKGCVEYFLTFNEFSRKERIDALELLGAVLSRSELGGCYYYLKRGMDERYRDPADIILKPQCPPVADLDSVVESQTPQELESRQHDWYKLGLEGLLVMRRILGEDSKHVVENCDFLCNALSMKLRYEEAFTVWKYSRKHSVVHKKLSCLYCHIPNIFDGMKSGGFPPTFPHYHDVLHLTVQEMEVQARSAELDETYLLGAAFNVVECIMFIMRVLPLASSDSDFNQLQDVTRRLISVAPRFHTDPVIHLAWMWVLVEYSDLTRDPTFTGLSASLFAFLAKCGADVSKKDSANNTLLHEICQGKRRDKDFLKFACSMARLLLELGADVDARNGKNQTPLNMTWSEDMRAVLLEYYPVSLKCLSASAIVQRGIPYQGRVPSAVERFIRIHESS